MPIVNLVKRYPMTACWIIFVGQVSWLLWDYPHHLRGLLWLL
jgi:hypothetical protein